MREFKNSSPCMKLHLKSKQIVSQSNKKSQMFYPRCELHQAESQDLISVTKNKSCNQLKRKTADSNEIKVSESVKTLNPSNTNYQKIENANHLTSQRFPKFTEKLIFGKSFAINQPQK